MSENPVLIVGAGPAGIRAAETLANAGLRPLVVDEGTRAGGQIYRRPPPGFTRSPETLYGTEASKACALHATFDGLVQTGRIEYLPQSSILGFSAAGAHASTPEGERIIPHEQRIIAVGATDRLVPVPGWQAPGVYSLGAAQIALKAQGVALGRRLVLAGSGPLLTLVACQLLKAGARVEAVLDTAPLMTQFAALPAMLTRPVFAGRGVIMRARLGRRYHAGVSLSNIESNPTGVTAVHWTDARGKRHRSSCDMIAMGWHLRAETQLAGLSGADFDWSETWSQWLPRADRQGRVRDGVYLAGDGLRILGADGAEVAGRLAAAACLTDMGRSAPDVRRDLARLDRLERFAGGIARAFPWPAAMVQALPDTAVVCRCESVTVAALRASADHGGAEANRVKSLGRVGMGRCQGRYCQLAAAELIAAHSGVRACDVGRLRDQAPVRPALVGGLTKSRPADSHDPV